jgi:hypothetical protein
MKKFVQKGTSHRWEWTESYSGELTITAGCFTGSLNQLVERIESIGGWQLDEHVALIQDALRALGRSEEVSAVFVGHGRGSGSGSGREQDCGCGGDGAGNGAGNGDGQGQYYGNGDGYGGCGLGYGLADGDGDGYGYGDGQGKGDGAVKFYEPYIFKKLIVKSRKPAGLECE